MNEILRDEILIQIINQIWNNIDLVKLNKAWVLMSNCISCFSPSSKFYKYLFKYLIGNFFKIIRFVFCIDSSRKKIHQIMIYINKNYYQQVHLMHHELIHLHN